MKEASVNLTPDIKSHKITLVAEGVETPLSIKDAISEAQKAHIQVLATLGKSNLSNISDDRSADRIILVLDNDKQDWRQDKTIQIAIKQMEQRGKSVRCIQPTLLNGQKTDYNDLAKAGKFNEIKRDVHHVTEPIERVNNRDKIETAQTSKIAPEKLKEVDRELFG
uniref:toprim domain-containing protein n=1 Tax=Coxiella burnetii TaxID=777 RepID=UPI001459E90D|nr:toprim domain-containing protein [Coxiella burnetii]